MSTKVHLLKTLAWSVKTYGCESGTLNKLDEERIRAFGMLGLRRILRMSWTAKCTNQWVLEKAGVSRSLLEAIKKRKLTYFGHTMRKQPGEGHYNWNSIRKTGKR